MIALEVDGTVINTPSMFAQSTAYGQRISVNYLPAGCIPSVSTGSKTA